MDGRRRAAAAEVLLAALVVGYGAFSVYSLVLLLLLASQSLWLRELGWRHLGLERDGICWSGVFRATVTAAAVLVAVRFVIAPFAIWVTAQPIDLSGLVRPGDTSALMVRLVQAWTLAAFGEEMVFRGYLVHRTADLVGQTRVGWATGVGVSSTLFGLAHLYQGWGGVVAATVIGIVLGTVYLLERRNLWVVIGCHALVDTVALVALYLGRGTLVVPR